jgi:hypothetical protein
MKPISNELTTITLGAPSNWNEETMGKCSGLPVCRQDEQGVPSYYSYWETTWRERLQILFGRPLRLNIVGHHPPVNIDTEIR